jgi:hypothetical protein
MSVQESPSPPTKRKSGKVAETDHDKFRRLVIPRMRRLKGCGRLVKNCAAYEFTEDEKEKVIAEVFRLSHEIKSAFENANKAGSKRDEFSL